MKCWSKRETSWKKIDIWLGEGKWDVIHFNFGIYDRATLVGRVSIVLFGVAGWCHANVASEMCSKGALIAKAKRECDFADFVCS